MPTLDEEQALMEKSKELLIYVTEKGFLDRGTSGILGAALKVMDEKVIGARRGCRREMRLQGSLRLQN